MNAIQLYARASDAYAHKIQASVNALRQTLQQNPGTWAQAHSLGAEDVVTTALLRQAAVLDAVEVFVLDTGRLHGETLALIPRLEAHFGIALRVHRGDAQAIADFDQANGQDAMRQSLSLRKACCDLRKTQPLSQALAGKRGWITGLRREQSAARSAVALLQDDGPRLKLNPLCDWTWGDVWQFIAERGLPYHPLHDAFYPSIGCAPCTRAITLGEDFRAGRWWWESELAKECGLHVKPAAASSPLATATAAHRKATPDLTPYSALP